MTGQDLIYEERIRQVNEEGWSLEADDIYTRGELVRAAECYRNETVPFDHAPHEWPWDSTWWKPGQRIRNLTKAGALYLAEADRRQRAGATEDQIDAAYNSAMLCAAEIDSLGGTDG